MATTFVPLSSELIDEGEFIENLDKELAALQKTLASYVKEHGAKAEKAVAKLSIEISIKVQNTESEAYSITTAMKTTIPKRPATVSLAIGGIADDGSATLFVRRDGSDETRPEQGKLFKTHGKSE